MSKIDFSKNSNAEQATAPVSFSQPPQPASAEQPAAPTTAVVTRPAMPVGPSAVWCDTPPDFRDIKFPRLNIVQKVGDLSNIYPHGAILWAGAQLIFELPVKTPQGEILKPGTPPVEIQILGIKPKQWTERVDFESGERGLVVDNEEAVIRAGGTTSWQEYELKKAEGLRLFQPMAEAMIAVRRPEHVADPKRINFTYKVGDQDWALGLWTMKNSAFTSGTKTLYTARTNGCLREGYPTFTYNLSTVLKEWKSKFYFIPVLVPRDPSSPELLAFARQVLAIE